MEELMQYVWQFRLWPTKDMVTVDGKRVEVIDPGSLNRDAGPDFFNAKISIGGQMWSGNVEIHVRASDWHRHRHSDDPAYDTIILHVVEKDDARITRKNGMEIPQMVMECAANFSQKYHALVNDPLRQLACGPELPTIPLLNISDWITSLGFQRLQQKADRVMEYVKQSSGSWLDAIYIALARSLGFGTNSEPFELLAKTTPIRYILRHSDAGELIEAILFGQAGLLGPANGENEYQDFLSEHYRFLSAKYSLQPSKNIMWKMSRMRPQNMPHRRIAALAIMLRDSFPICHAILNIKSAEEAFRQFEFNLDGYWARHYNFTANPGAPTVKAFSKASQSIIIINCVAPILYAYGESVGDTEKQQLAIEILQQLAAEQNSIIRIFEQSGLKAQNAFEGQALIHLRKEYCMPRKCLFCRWGHRLLSAKAKRQK
ncbi:MAG: DUF2851 family protein [Clostridium sp.]|nr:DUF2851 family protein [Clostridium sp.]